MKRYFSCTQCGFCCQGETTVSLSSKDQKRMQEHLGLNRDEMVARYWRISGQIVQMKTVDGHCTFFRNGCSVHPGRPWRCAQWPLVPAILESKENFEIIKDSCPGITTDVTYAEFVEALKNYLAEKFDEEDFLRSLE